MQLPEFTTTQCKDLQKLGLHPEQIEQLRIALYEISAGSIQPATGSSVRKYLDEIEKLASRLEKKLVDLSLSKNVAQRGAHNLLEVGFWKRRLLDYGPTAPHVIVPQLAALADSAREARASLPKRNGRPGTVNPRSIRVIDEALRLGWAKHWTVLNVFASAYPQSRDNSLLPSASPTSRFMRICQICYAAVGRDEANLERPMKAYVQLRKRQSVRDKAAFVQGVNSIRDKTPKK